MDNELECNILASLLQFYSDRAIANASFLVASVFGLFVVLSLMSNPLLELFGDTWWALAVTYWFLWGFGLYSLLNFGHYAQCAQVAKERIKGRSDVNLEESILGEARANQVRWFSDFKRGQKCTLFIGLLRSAKTIFMLPSYFLFIGVLPFTAVNRILTLTIPAIIFTGLYVVYRVVKRRRHGSVEGAN